MLLCHTSLRRNFVRTIFTGATKNRPRVLINGCWDLLHTGHYNALRQSYQLAQNLKNDKFINGNHINGDSPCPPGILVAGIHSNDEIKKVKGGAFLISDAEKAAMLTACKFVDEIIMDVPYTKMTPALLDKYGIDYAAHGDDMPILPDGTKMYGPVEEAGRYLVFKRSEGISTTNLLNRLLRATEQHNLSENQKNNFILSSQRFSQFSNFPKKSLADARSVVYIDGDFDFFHMGHVEILRNAKALGDYLIVGIHSDIDVQGYRTRLPNSILGSYPVMNVGERAICLLSCKYVDDIILHAPLNPNNDFLGALSIKKMCVVEGHGDFLGDFGGRLKVPHDWKMVHEIKVEKGLFSTKTLFDRFLNAREEFVVRNRVKKDPVIVPVFA